MRGLALFGAMIAFAAVVYADTDTYTYFFGQEKIDMPSASGYFARYWLFGLLALGGGIAVVAWWRRKRWNALRGMSLLGAMIAFGVSFALFLTAVFGFVFDYADKLAGLFGHEKTEGLSAGAHFARNLGFGLLAFIGILMAAWRNREMSRQADAEIDQAKAALAQSRASEKHADAALAQSRASEKHADAALAQSRTSEKQADIALGQIKNENDRIIREQFSNSVKTLAQNENSKPAIAARIGGIYALQSLANNYVSQYAAQVVKTLVAYVKVNVQLTKILREDLEISFLGEDVKAAFVVLAQLLDVRDESPEKKFELSDNDLDFSECDFSRLCLDYKQVSGLWHYRWQGSDLRGSDLHCADFRTARMYGAQLQGANLRGANLKGARLHNADLRGASLGMGSTDKKFEQTNLQGAKLRGADLRGAAFSAAHADLAADLSRADLNDAKLQDTDLRGVNLSGVENLPELFSNQIWHSEQPELKGVESIKMSPDRVWDLEPYRDCPYALAGVLRNYKVIYDHGIIPIPLRGLLKAARKLLDDLPKGFSDIWRKWLEGS